MVEVCWSQLPAIVAGQAFRIKKMHAEEQRIKKLAKGKKKTDDIFVCERVCTSKRMLKKVGALHSQRIRFLTLVTVCGVSDMLALMPVLALSALATTRYLTGMT